MLFLLAVAMAFLLFAAWETHRIHATRLGPHWVEGWRWPHMGVAIGQGKDEYLMIDLPDGVCAHAVKHTSPHMATFYTDAAAAKAFLRREMCPG